MLALRVLATLLIAGAALPVFAQAPGWSYSPLPGEGDRAAMGCADDAPAGEHACLVVRCEDDFSVGFYVTTSRPGGDLGLWRITIDKEERPFDGVATETPYGARLKGDAFWLRDRLEQGTHAHILSEEGPLPPGSSISLGGSLRNITLALAHCAPRRPALVEPMADPGV
ncbi:hypothetical protein EMQ25_13270 [Arsenicitalea aurantiaca]|uniref:DUF992 domain-containing protein n=1 Tax=Arsenicitalea aurantiaca TaxID=1783274 RepID=A0A433X8A5_9HYPH|nr:hypothetical protein [Arsenicitalea aurantiaca]RUT30278.1 hypothetical protein EMQ25_13270 [Arsenicitalea aurantiaca]